MVLLPAALGVKPFAPAVLAEVFQAPLQLPIGSRSVPDARLVGRVKDRVTPLVAALVTVKVPAPASVMAMVLLTPGVTLPNWRLFPAATVSAESTVAVAWMLALCLRLGSRGAGGQAGGHEGREYGCGAHVLLSPIVKKWFGPASSAVRGVRAPRRPGGGAMRVPAVAG